METIAIILTLAAFLFITVSTWRKAIKAIQQYNKIIKRTKADQEEKAQAREFIKNFAKSTWQIRKSMLYYNHRKRKGNKQMTKQDIINEMEALGVKWDEANKKRFMRYTKDMMLRSLETTKNYLKSLEKERF